MIPVYNDIAEDIIDLIRSSELQGRKLKYLVLNKKEYDELVSKIPGVEDSEYKEDGTMGTYFDLEIVGIKCHTARIRALAEERL